MFIFGSEGCGMVYPQNSTSGLPGGQCHIDDADSGRSLLVDEISQGISYPSVGTYFLLMEAQDLPRVWSSCMT
jgi:hypothetical protein